MLEICPEIFEMNLKVRQCIFRTECTLPNLVSVKLILLTTYVCDCDTCIYPSTVATPSWKSITNSDYIIEYSKVKFYPIFSGMIKWILKFLAI